MTDRPFKEDVACIRCGHVYRLHTMEDPNGGLPDSCSACTGCRHFLPACPLRKVLKATRKYAWKRHGDKKVWQKIGWAMELSCGHAFTQENKKALLACPLCVRKEDSGNVLPLSPSRRTVPPVTILKPRD